jgi:hypothetical protein
MPTILTDYHGEILNTMKGLARGDKWWSAPMNLGGVPGISGGTGGPVGGLYGLLVQTRVAYDTSEAAYSGIHSNPPSGTLLDNLAHIRLRLEDLEAASGVIVLDDYVELGNTQYLDFADGLTVTIVSGRARIFNTGGLAQGSGVNVIKSKDNVIATQVTCLNLGDGFYPASSPSVSGQVDITLTGWGPQVIWSGQSFTDVQRFNFTGSGITVTSATYGTPPYEHTSLVLSIPGYTPGIPNVEIYDEGVLVGYADSMNFVGPGVVASISGSVAEIVVNSGISVNIEDDGVAQGTASILNFQDELQAVVIADRAYIQILPDGKYWESLAAPSSEDDYNDEFSAGLGVQWIEFDPNNNLVPTIEDWGLQLTPTPASSEMIGVYQLFEDAPDDYTFWTKVDILSPQESDYKAGLWLLSGAINDASPMYWFGICSHDSGINFQFEKWTDYVTYDSSIINEDIGSPNTPHLWLKARIHDGSGIYIDTSQDGIGWIQRWNHAGLDFGNIGAIGLMVRSTTGLDSISIHPFFRGYAGNSRITVTEGRRISYIAD